MVRRRTMVSVSAVTLVFRLFVGVSIAWFGIASLFFCFFGVPLAKEYTELLRMYFQSVQQVLLGVLKNGVTDTKEITSDTSFKMTVGIQLYTKFTNTLRISMKTFQADRC